MSDSEVNKLWGLKCITLKTDICDPSGLMLHSLFLLGNAYCYLNSDVLKNTVMDLAYNCINYIPFGREKCWNVNISIAVILKSVQSTLSHLTSTSVLRATFTRFLGLFQYCSY